MRHNIKMISDSGTSQLPACGELHQKVMERMSEPLKNWTPPKVERLPQETLAKIGIETVPIKVAGTGGV